MVGLRCDIRLWLTLTTRRYGLSAGASSPRFGALILGGRRRITGTAYRASMSTFVRVEEEQSCAST